MPSIYRRRKSHSDTLRDNAPVPLMERIISFLQSIAPRPAQPKEIAFELGISHEAVKKSIARLYGKRSVEQCGRGWYRALYSLDSILKAESPEMRLHGIKIEGNVPKMEGASLSCPLFLDMSAEASGNRRISKLLWDGRTVTVQISPNGRLEIQVMGSRYPLSFIEFERFAGWLEGMSAGQSTAWELQIVQLGIGRDFRWWWLDGVKSIKFGQWRNAWAQIYRKSQSMRAEIHIQERLGLGDAIHILKGMTEAYKPPQPAPEPKHPDPRPGMYG